MNTVIPESASIPRERHEQMFPRLSPAQIARVSAHGTRRFAERGEILIDQGEPTRRFFLVLSGKIEILRPSGGELIVVHEAGQFAGDVHMLSGRNSVVRARMAGRVPVDEHHGRLVRRNRRNRLRLADRRRARGVGVEGSATF